MVVLGSVSASIAAAAAASVCRDSTGTILLWLAEWHGKHRLAATSGASSVGAATVVPILRQSLVCPVV